MAVLLADPRRSDGKHRLIADADGAALGFVDQVHTQHDLGGVGGTATMRSTLPKPSPGRGLLVWQLGPATAQVLVGDSAAIQIQVLVILRLWGSDSPDRSRNTLEDCGGCRSRSVASAGGFYGSTRSVVGRFFSLDGGSRRNAVQAHASRSLSL